MYQLFQFPLCPFSRKVRLLLGEKGVGYELVRESPWERRDEFLDMNPAGKTPVMKLHVPTTLGRAALTNGSESTSARLLGRAFVPGRWV